MKVRKLNPTDLEFWYGRNIDYKNRTIYFGPWHPNEEMISESRTWEVDDWSAQSLIKSLYALDKENHSAITVWWFSCGGDWDAGMAIYDFMQIIKSPIIMKCIGRVRSMGTIILQGAKNDLQS